MLIVRIHPMQYLLYHQRCQVNMTKLRAEEKDLFLGLWSCWVSTATGMWNPRTKCGQTINGRCGNIFGKIHGGFPSMEMFHCYDFPVLYTIHIPFPVYTIYGDDFPILTSTRIPHIDETSRMAFITSEFRRTVQVCEERTRDPEGDGGCEVRPEARRWKVVGEGKRGWKVYRRWLKMDDVWSPKIIPNMDITWLVWVSWGERVCVPCWLRICFQMFS